MKLMMYLGNDLIEAIPVNFSSVSQPGYLGRFKRQLKQKYAELILQAGAEPEFLIHNVTPATDRFVASLNGPAAVQQSFMQYR